MSFFAKYEIPYNVYLPIKGEGDQRVYNFGEPDYVVEMFWIRINDADAMIEEQELGNWRANVKDPNASKIVEGAKVQAVSGGTMYEVVGYPRYNRTFKRWKVNGKETNK